MPLFTTADFGGTWKYESSSPNFEEFLTTMNVGFVKRKAILTITPEIIIKQNGDDFLITTETPVSTSELRFKVGEEFTDDQDPLKDGPTKTIINWDGDVLVQKSVDNDKDPIISRSIEDGKLILKLKLGDIEAKRVFQKVELAKPGNFNGTWKFESASPNFEEFLTAMNVGFVKRMAILSIQPEFIIKQEGDDFKITTETPVTTSELKFKVGEEFTDDQDPLKDGPTKKIISWDGDVLVQKSVDNDKDPIVTRSIEDGKLVLTQKLGDIEAKRVFHKCE